MLFSCVVSLHSELMKTELRDYQIEMRDRLYEAWKRCRSVMVQMPTFERIQRFEVAIDGEQIYMRQSSKEWDKPFAKDNVLVREKDYVIFGNKLVFLNDTGRVYEVCGYEDNVYVYIKWHEMSDNDYQYACVGPKGTIVSYLRELPGRLMPRPTKLSKMGLIPFFNVIGNSRDDRV